MCHFQPRLTVTQRLWFVAIQTSVVSAAVVGAEEVWVGDEQRHWCRRKSQRRLLRRVFQRRSTRLRHPGNLPQRRHHHHCNVIIIIIIVMNIVIICYNCHFMSSNTIACWASSCSISGDRTRQDSKTSNDHYYWQTTIISFWHEGIHIKPMQVRLLTVNFFYFCPKFSSKFMFVLYSFLLL